MDCEVVIVGAGPAGAVAAWELARRGRHVILADRARFPRPKPCGGGLTRKTMQCLGLNPGDLEAIACEGVVFFHDGAMPRAVRVRHGGVFVHRDVLDDFLVRRAVAAGAQFVPACAIADVAQDARGVTVAGPKCRWRAAVAIGADGALSRVARALGLRRRARFAFGVTAFAAGAETASTDNMMLFDLDAVPAGYGWIFPCPGGLNFGLYSLRPRLPDLQRRLRRFAARYPVTAALTPAAIRGVGAPVPIGGRHEPLDCGRVVLVGDAAGLVDPFLGEGIYNAVLSARVAAEVVDDFLHGHAPDLRRYTRRVRQEIVMPLAEALDFARLYHLAPQLAYALTLTPPGARGWCVRMVMLGEPYRSLLPRLPGNILAGFGHGLRLFLSGGPHVPRGYRPARWRR